MRFVDIVTLAALTPVSLGVPLSTPAGHMNVFDKRADFNSVGSCRLTKGVNIPNFPNQDLVLDLEKDVSARPGITPVDHKRMREAFWGGLGDPTAPGAYFPHWYHHITYDGKVTTGDPKIEKIPSTDARFLVAGPFGNVDHVFEHHTLRQFLGKMIGVGDPLDPPSLVASPESVAECGRWQTSVGKRPPYYPPIPKKKADKLPFLDDDANYNIINIVFQHLPGFDQLKPNKYAQNEFAGLSEELNRHKGRVFEGQMESRYQQGHQSWFKGTTDAELTGRVADIEGVTNVFELMRRPEMAAIYKRTCLRLSKLMYGIDYYLQNGNKAQFSDPSAPFKNAKGDKYKSFGEAWETWLPRYLEFVSTGAYKFVKERIEELEDDVNKGTVTATNKDEIKERLKRIQDLHRDEDAFLKFDVGKMTEFATGVAQRTDIFRVAEADREPFLHRPFTDAP